MRFASLASRWPIASKCSWSTMPTRTCLRPELVRETTPLRLQWKGFLCGPSGAPAGCSRARPPDCWRSLRRQSLLLRGRQQVGSPLQSVGSGGGRCSGLAGPGGTHREVVARSGRGEASRVGSVQGHDGGFTAGPTTGPGVLRQPSERRARLVPDRSGFPTSHPIPTSPLIPAGARAA